MYVFLSVLYPNYIFKDGTLPYSNYRMENHFGDEGEIRDTTKRNIVRAQHIEKW